MIKREEIVEFAMTLPFTSFDNPFDNNYDATVLRHSDTKKWFGIVMKAPCKKIGLSRDGETDVLTLKCDPMFSHTLFENFEGIIPAYHMNKNLWITIVLEKNVPKEEIFSLINMSFALTLPKKKMEKYLEENR